MELSLPAFEYRVKRVDGTLLIYDVIRKKYVTLTPEEWVRQHVVHYLLRFRNYPISGIAVEKEIRVCGLKRRFDLVCYDRKADPWLIVECKAASVKLSREVFDQAFGYNLCLEAPYIAVTNGIEHFCGTVGENREFTLLREIPGFPQEK